MFAIVFVSEQCLRANRDPSRRTLSLPYCDKNEAGVREVLLARELALTHSLQEKISGERTIREDYR